MTFINSRVCGAHGGLVLTEETIDSLEKLSRNWCFSLHRLRCEILGLKLGTWNTAREKL